MYSGAKEAIQDVADMEVREEAEARDGKGGDPMNVLAVLKAQRERAIGLDNDDGELQTERADLMVLLSKVVYNHQDPAGTSGA